MTQPRQESERRWCEACRDHYDGSHYDEHGNHRAGAEFGPVGKQMMAEQVAKSEREELLHTMHDASKFAAGATKAILEGVLHRYEYATREPPFQGNRCACPHCRQERLDV